MDGDLVKLCPRGGGPAALWTVPNQARLQLGLSWGCALIEPHPFMGRVCAMAMGGASVWRHLQGSVTSGKPYSGDHRELIVPPTELALSGGPLWGGVSEKATPLIGRELLKNAKW